MTKAFRIITFLAAFLVVPSVFATDNYHATAHGGKYPTYPTIHYGTGKKAKLIKRGEYLAKLGDCIACHTKGGKPFAGGRAIKTPFGTIYTPNITSDKATGIGKWSDKDFIRALREGINPQGKYYYPAFPYIYFNKITTKDIIALRAYLNAIPAVHQKNRNDTMMFPFNWRFIQLGWRLMFFHFQKSGPFVPNPKKSKKWNRGAYIVESFGHCAMCHTTMHHFIFKKWVLGAPVLKYNLTGGFVQGFYAPNISSTGLKNTPWETIADVFKKDKLIGGGKVQGPMAEANHDSLKYLNSADIQAITVYLESVKSQVPPRPKLGAGAGKKIFNQYCQGCHLTGAGGAPRIGDIATWKPRIKLGMNTLYKNAINGYKGMPPKGTCSTCTDKAIQEAVRYIVNHSKPGGAIKMGGPPIVKPVKRLTLADGKRIYNRYCSACHDGNYHGAPKLGDKQAWKPLIGKGMPNLLINSIRGIGNMPPRGGCDKCNDAQIIAAVKYMVNRSKTKGDYQLW